MKKKIIPIMKNCLNCNKEVKNHHLYCDKCWGINCKKLDIIKKRKLLGITILDNKIRNAMSIRFFKDDKILEDNDLVELKKVESK